MAILETMEAVSVSARLCCLFILFRPLLCPSSEILTSSCLLPDVPGAICLDLNSHCCSLSCWCHNILINAPTANIWHTTQKVFLKFLIFHHLENYMIEREKKFFKGMFFFRAKWTSFPIPTNTVGSLSIFASIYSSIQ